MSKDFEQAYRELAQIEVPDLWERIEAGLKEKSTPAEALNIEKAENKKTENETQIVAFTAEPKENKSVLVFFRKYTTVAAALVCVAVLIPAITLIGQFGIGGSKTESAVEECAEAPAEAVMEEAAAEEAPAESVVEEAAAEEAPAESVVEEAAAEEAPAETVMEEAAAEEALPDAPAQMATTTEEEVEEEMVEMAEEGAEKESLVDRCPEGTLFEHVQIQVLEVLQSQEYFTEAAGGESGQIYLVEVQDGTHGLLTQGEQIAIFIPEYFSIALMQDGVYDLTLRFVVAEEECYFEIEQYHKQLEP